MSGRFLGHYVRSQRFTLGVPRTFTVSPDGQRVVFLRAPGGEDPATCLWILDVTSGHERLVADPRDLGAGHTGDETPEERLRRERTRDAAGGITAYACDRSVRLAAFALAGQLYTADLVAGAVVGHDHALEAGVVDPQPSPDGSRVAYVRHGRLWVVDLTDGTEAQVAGDDAGTTLTWGLAEFVAAEEMGRTRGFWWSPQGTQLAVTRVDTEPVAPWYLGDPAEPSMAPRTVRYPAAGAANADVALFVVDLDGARQRVPWDGPDDCYLARVHWDDHGPLLLLGQSRDQRRLRVLAHEPSSGQTTVVRDDAAAPWLEPLPGVPRWLPGQRLLHGLDDADTHRVAVDGVALSPPGLHLRSVVEATDSGVIVTASAQDPTAVGVWRIPLDGGEPEPLTGPGGVSSAAAATGAPTLVVQRRDLEGDQAQTAVTAAASTQPIASRASPWPLRLNARRLQLGPRELQAIVLLPAGHEPDGPALPVLCDPYGGPHAQRVLQHAGGLQLSQWFAEQGYAVLVADGRGTPGRGLAWERAVAGDLVDVPLVDQVEALRAAGEQLPAMDLGRVGIRGWSFGGTLAAAAVLRRPDVFHAAVAGAPVTDWRLYDTHYTERYLGLPDEQPEAFRRNSLLDDAPGLCRPLLLIHGLADDNVVAAHSLRLSQALLAAGRAHQVLPLSQMTHMSPQETLAERLLELQVTFFDDALDAGAAGRARPYARS